MFLNENSVPGESSDSQHQDWIDVVSCETNTSSKVGQNMANPLGVSESLITFTKYVDKATPLLQIACSSGKVFGEAGILS